MEKKLKYDAFISYSQNPDKELAIAIRKGLMELGAKKYLLQFRALSVFRDETDLSGRGSLTERIQKGVDTSKYLVVIIRPQNAVNATENKINWVEKELEYWFESKRKRISQEDLLENDYFIILCIADGEIAWRNNDFISIENNCINKILFNKFKPIPKWVDLRQLNKRSQYQRGNTSVFSLKDPEFLQKTAEISAQIQGKTVDELIAEDRRRQRMWSGILGLASLALVALTIASFIFAREARQNRDEAIVKQKEADRQKEIALSNLKKFKLEEFRRNIRNGGIYYDADEPCLAKAAFDSALNTLKEYDSIPEFTVEKSDLLRKFSDCSKKCLIR